MRFKLNHLFVDRFDGPAQDDFPVGDYRVAVVALLLHLINADGKIAPQEEERLRLILSQRFELDARAARRLIARAEASRRDTLEISDFTSVLKRTLGEDGRLAVIELLWEVAFADGVAHEFEQDAIWRIADLLDVAQGFSLLKEKAENEGRGASKHKPSEGA